MLILSFCSFPWWLAWLLPFLLGLLAGWAIWSKYKSMVADLEARISDLKGKISGLEGDLATCNSKRADAESELALVKGRIRELETELAGIKASATLEDADPSVVATGIAAAAAGETSDESPVGAGGDTSIYAAIKEDNLQVVEGIGPKMEEVLKENGVSTLGQLAGMNKGEIDAILAKYGNKYTRIIDPTTWPQQAALANEDKWEELIVMQKSLDTGRSDRIGGTTDSKVEKLLIKMGVLKKYKQDDLKAVEGIGPKIESLLHDAGIKTWRGLAETPVEKIQSVLDAAGSRYKLADPATWPKQAEMAADGKWKELKEYQDFLQGGRE